MKRRLLATLLCLAISVSVAACGSNNNSTEQTEVDNNVDVGEETESTELTDADTSWDKVGIVDGIGTVYNGETVELKAEELTEEEIAQGIITDGKYAFYEFEEIADFLQFVNADISYQGANVKVWLLEHRKSRVSLSGNYELKETSRYNDGCGRCYDLIVDGNCIVKFDVEGESQDTPLEDCELGSFWLYPTEGLVFNGYEFTDTKMEGVVNYFGNPNFVSYDVYSSGNQHIDYTYREEISVTILENVSCGTSEVVFNTTDGKNIEDIDIRLSLTEEEIIAQREWQDEIDTEENVEETSDNRESASVPVDGRDGSQESPYRVGDSIYFPKVVMRHGYDGNEYVSLTVVVEEVTSEYIKVSYKFETDSWGEHWKTIDSLVFVHKVDSEFMAKDVQLNAQIEETGNKEFTVVYQTAEGLGWTEDASYLMLTFTDYCMLEEPDFSVMGAEYYPLFVEVSNP